MVWMDEYKVGLLNKVPFYRVPTQVLQSLIKAYIRFSFVRPYKVLFLGYFLPEGLIIFLFCLKKKVSEFEVWFSPCNKIT